jgi:hypothetical protein
MNHERRFDEWEKDQIDYIVQTIGFYGLVGVIRAIIAQHYPTDIFAGSPDKGPRFIDKLREALAILDE